MAIKIPSKNIYQIDNKKVLKNLIDNISVEQTVVAPNNEYDVSLYNENLAVSLGDPISASNGERQTIVQRETYVIQGGNIDVWFFCSHIGYYQKSHTQSFTVKIPKIQNNSFVSKIYYGKNDDGENQIKYSLIGNKYEGNCTATVQYNTNSLTGNISNINIGDVSFFSPTSSTVDQRIEIPTSDTYIYTATVNEGQISGTTSISTTAKLQDTSTLTLCEPTDIEENDIEYYQLTFNIVGAVTIAKMGGNSSSSSSMTISGSYERYYATNVELTIYGNTIGISLTDGTVSYIKDQNGNIVQGKGNKPHSLSGNELLQNGSKTNGVLLTEHLANNVLNQYAKGKETATLLCDINEYYNESNELEISTKGKPLDTISFSANVITTSDTHNIIIILDDDYVHDKDLAFDVLFSTQNKSTNKKFILKKGNNILDITIPRPFSEETKIYTNDTVREILPMGFQIGDEVIPYVFGADGKDKPMSLKQDGTPKVFVVVGTNKIYDGAVWQELYLQEK